MTEDTQDELRDTSAAEARTMAQEETPVGTPEEIGDETGADRRDAAHPSVPDPEALRLELLRRIRGTARIEGNAVSLPRDVMADVLALALGDVVDEDWYRERYPDVGDAVERGVLASAAAHYVMAGIYEGRMPYRVPLDNAAYLESHPDVLASIREGAFRSALDHFVKVGFAEGRTFRLASREAPEP